MELHILCSMELSPLRCVRECVRVYVCACEFVSVRVSVCLDQIGPQGVKFQDRVLQLLKNGSRGGQKLNMRRDESRVRSLYLRHLPGHCE